MSCRDQKRQGGNGKTIIGDSPDNGGSQATTFYESITSQWAKTWLPVISLLLSIIILLKK